MDLQRGRCGQADEVAASHFGELDLAAMGEIAAARGHQHQAILAEQEPLDAVGQSMLGGKAEIGRAGRDRRGDVGAFTLLDIDIDVGVFAQEGGERPRQMLRQA